MAKRPESRWFLARAYALGVLGLMGLGSGGAAALDHPPRRALGACLLVGGAVLVAMGARGLYRWRVRRKNGHLGR